MYKPVETNLNFVDREKEVLAFWKEENIFEKSVKKNEGNPEFSFYDGPPTANGKPHIGHILTRVMKDIIPRYKTMKGYHVLRKAGWDITVCPSNLKSKNNSALTANKKSKNTESSLLSKSARSPFGNTPTSGNRCPTASATGADHEKPVYHLRQQLHRVGVVGNQTDGRQGAYLQRLQNRALLPSLRNRALFARSCARLQRRRGNFRIRQIQAQRRRQHLFSCLDDDSLDAPVQRRALHRNAKEDYTKIQVGDEFYVLADALIPSLFKDEAEYVKIDTKKGSEYEYVEYEPLFDYETGAKEKGYYVTNDSYVTLTDGTGIVHIAPAFGEDDSKVGKKYNLPFVQMVDDRGRFKDAVYDFKGLFCKDADKYIIEKLKGENKLFKTLKFTHSYPFCWRCDTPLLYYARSSWFVKMTAVKEQLLASNDSVNWMPDTIKKGRMGNFLENVIDWGISRERYWGTPLPIWVCNKCGKVHVIGSREELREKAHLDHDVELHRPYIDDVKWECECGGEMVRTPEVLDCWFDSGSMPFAQWHYPFENKEVFEKVFPADFISEAVDQTRGWFYTLLAVSTVLFGRRALQKLHSFGTRQR